MNEIVLNAEKFRENVTLSVQSQGTTLETVYEELTILLSDILDELKAEFLPSDEAPSHDERVVRVSVTMSKVENGIVGLGEKIGMSEEHLRVHLGNIRPHVERLVVITGPSRVSATPDR
jgi:hypothetical protein